MANGKVEEFQGLIKKIFYTVSRSPEHANEPVNSASDRALEIYNQSLSWANSYWPAILAFSREALTPRASKIDGYERELPPEKQDAAPAELVREVPLRHHAHEEVLSGKAARDELRSMAAEKKAITRIDTKGD